MEQTTKIFKRTWEAQRCRPTKSLARGIFCACDYALEIIVCFTYIPTSTALVLFSVYAGANWEATTSSFPYTVPSLPVFAAMLQEVWKVGMPQRIRCFRLGRLSVGVPGITGFSICVTTPSRVPIEGLDRVDGIFGIHSSRAFEQCLFSFRYSQRLPKKLWAQKPP